MRLRGAEARRRRQLRQRAWLIAGVVAALALGTLASPLAGLATLLTLYLLRELLAADHIFYSPLVDYRYEFPPHAVRQAELRGDSLRVDWGTPPGSKPDTAFLELVVRATPAGHWFDPYAEAVAADVAARQYFERGADGVRYVNISDLIDASLRGSGDLRLRFRFCRADPATVRVVVFTNPRLDGKRLLVVAPHADDAEIAAFGLYGAHDSHVVTLTAGELEADNYRPLCATDEQASRLKGRLRALDTVSAAIWAGLAPERSVNLGYFCMRLKDMFASPDLPMGSLTAGTEDVRPFRRFNSRTLPSDSDGSPTWRNLVSDLRAIVATVAPQVIVTPHPELDPHPDHHFATVALKEALAASGHRPECLLLYANHYANTDLFPYGPAHSAVSLPPNFEPPLSVESVLAFRLSEERQLDKAFALEIMHDLKRPLDRRRRLRRQLQYWLLARPITPYGEDDYFRKAVRPHEVFFRVRQL